MPNKPPSAAPRRRHTPQHDHRTPAPARGYDAAWTRLRNAHIRQHPLCGRCSAAGRTTPAQDVHHIQRIADRPDLRLRWSNLEAICRQCHAKHHAGAA